MTRLRGRRAAPLWHACAGLVFAFAKATSAVEGAAPLPAELSPDWLFAEPAALLPEAAAPPPSEVAAPAVETVTPAAEAAAPTPPVVAAPSVETVAPTAEEDAPVVARAVEVAPATEADAPPPLVATPAVAAAAAAAPVEEVAASPPPPEFAVPVDEAAALADEVAEQSAPLPPPSPPAPPAQPALPEPPAPPVPLVSGDDEDWSEAPTLAAAAMTAARGEGASTEGGPTAAVATQSTAVLPVPLKLAATADGARISGTLPRGLPEAGLQVMTQGRLVLVSYELATASSTVAVEQRMVLGFDPQGAPQVTYGATTGQLTIGVPGPKPPATKLRQVGIRRV